MINRLGFFRSYKKYGRLLLWLILAHSVPCNAGSPMFDAGQEAYLNGDIATALTLWRPLAEHGEAEAQFALGTIYYGGIGVEVDLTESSYWFLRAAQQGYAPAQYNLGNAYQRGEGVRRNEKRAAQWWRKAADQGLAPAQYNLATAYIDGAGVIRNEQKARALFQKSADGGHYPAVQALELLDKSASKPDLPGSDKREAAGSASCADWLGRQDPNSYTLQLMSSTERSDTQKILNQHALDPHAICAYEKEAQQRYMLLHGVFPDRAAAEKRISALPARLRQNKPWIRQIRAINAQVSVTPEPVEP